MPRMRKVVDPVTGDLARNKTSKELNVTELYGRVRVYPEKRQFSHGIFPSDHNYPPSRDGRGNRIDYGLKQHGGPFAQRMVRTQEVAVPDNPALHTRGVLKNSTVQRAREADMLRSLQAGRAAASVPPRVPSTSAGTSSGGGVGGSHALSSHATTTATAVLGRAAPVGGGGGGGGGSRAGASPSRRLGTGNSSSRRSATSLASRGSASLRASALRPETSSLSRASTATSLSSWQEINASKDRHIAALRAQLDSVKSSR